MALPSMRFTIHIVLSLIIFSSYLLFSVPSFEFEVGGTLGWIVPPENDTAVYNNWASEKRFQVGDTIRFEYKKDSVMEVNREDYKKCNSTRPKFFANHGNTIIKLDRSGYFYFISGTSGHCERGQRMIVKVLSEDEPRSTGSHGHGTTSLMGSIIASTFQFLLLYVASHIF